MTLGNIEELKASLANTVKIENGNVIVTNKEMLQTTLIDSLVFSAVFSPCEETRFASSWLIRRIAITLGAFPSSIQGLYEAFGTKEISNITIPAINIRTMSYDVACSIFRAAIKNKVGAVIFEIARSEIDYTIQRPAEYATAITAAAIKTGWQGGIFLQGDHFQISASKYANDSKGELKFVKDLIWEAIEAGFYNIDIDTSTLVDLQQPTIKAQQQLNFSLAAELTAFIRDLEPEGITISVGGEIGEVGGKNSTVDELRAFMDGYKEELDQLGDNFKGISKISVQTGTSHGGVPMPDGSVAKVKLDFDTLLNISRASIDEYGLAGAVQHGASTLPNEAFDRFPKCFTAEVHLATGFQNIIYDSHHFPPVVKKNIYDYLQKECASERKDSDTDEQFIYKMRKKGFGPFKKDLWEMPAENKKAIVQELENQFSFLFKKLNVANTNELVSKYVKMVDVFTEIPDSLLE